MESLRIVLFTSCWILLVKSQSTIENQHGYHIDPTSNPDQIYFEENRPHVIRNVLPEINNIVHQDSTGYPNVAQKPNLQRISAINTEQSADSSNRRMQVPSNKLQPPLYGTNKNSKFDGTDTERNIVNSSSNPNGLDPNSHLENVDALNSNNISRAITNFGLNLMKNIDVRANNVVISPYSIATLLALLQQGALGATQYQISEALQMLPEMAAEGFKNNYDILQNRRSRNILKVANNVYIADAFDLSPAFKKIATRYFGSEITPIRFTRPQEAVREINDWVAARTNNQIHDLLSSNAVGENSQLVLVNAVYFKGLWQSKFKPESTLPREFRLTDGGAKAVPFMRMRGVFKAGIDRSNNAHVIILPFENDQYSMMIALPPELSTLNSLVSSLSHAQLAAYHRFAPKEVSLEIPKFTVRGDTELNQVLMKMGVTNIFGHQSELSGLGTYRTFSPQVSAALHTAMLSIDEEGGSAAAATAFAVVALSYDDSSVFFKANRPFLAVLWDNQSALPLFIAKIEDPLA